MVFGAFFISMLLGNLPAVGASGDPLSGDNQQTLEQAIVNAAETARSGTHVPWHGGGDIGGVITPDRAYSSQTGAVCNGCTDPCRKVKYTVVTSQAMSNFRGVRCREATVDSGAAGTWSKPEADTQISYLPVVRDTLKKTRPPSAPPKITTKMKRLISDIQTTLSDLLYYRSPVDGNFGDTTQQALIEFLSDERLAVAPNPTDEVLQALKSATARIGYAKCPSAAGTQMEANIACGMVSD